MAQVSIEHVNLTVSDPGKSAEMLCAVFGWTIRWQGLAASGGRTIHVGCKDHYLAVYKPADSDGEVNNHAKGLPLNHIGICVDDLDETERRVIAYGLTPFNHGDYEPGHRFYFYDRDGIEFEIVSYGNRASI